MPNTLVIAFNRPDFTKKLAQSLLKAKPSKLFVALDGPRVGVKDDVSRCNAVKDIFETSNWECEVEYLINKSNYGCSNNIERAINWFFGHVDEGIILEDDCIPDVSFFRFASELLHKFRDNESIYQISGMSFTPSDDNVESYRFSRLVNIWGWATWKRAWVHKIDDLSGWPKMKAREIMKCYGQEELQQKNLIQKCYESNKEMTWGMKWRLTCLSNNALSVIPINNLIQNIGFNRKDSTSKTFYHPITDIKATSVRFPLIHPKKITVDIKRDECNLRSYYGAIEN